MHDPFENFIINFFPCRPTRVFYFVCSLVSFHIFVFFVLQPALPTAPTDVIISEVAATSVRLEWSYKGPEDLQYYVIQYKPKNANQVSAFLF